VSESTQPISDERLNEIGAIQDDVAYKLQLWQFADDAVAALVAVRAENKRLREIERLARIWVESTGLSPSLTNEACRELMRSALAAVSSPGEEPCWVCSVCGAVDDDEPADLSACPKCGEPPVSSPGEQDERANSHEQTINAWKSVSSPGEEPNA
jgi:hypothetical protein